ncbi:DNA-directed RNA polymerase subunit E'' [miscellaneous Crenarchaeota group-15 archaeon DG-45]|uniref:Transcription elongation factor Spt4 n=1 Tax=miscellaneous Crenarchaeota group-15 archaeon DG-45 TaxID=1685127 RepID=A0A0M0BRC1_9ARCH|nr:MAG: DNA-directed RNA polymerase subunit E'' [miscellaneous Crenarchaeota group-15 archaeon DG-45]
MSPRACRNCKTITDENICPNCRGADLGDDYSGLLIIIDHAGSQLAKKMDIKKEGRYALRIR